MKNKNKVLVSLAVLLTLTVCFSGVYSYAEYHTHTDFVAEHFEWVQDDGSKAPDEIVSHYPSNSVGSCAYTAMSLLLSFYDAYCDNRFVPDKYESAGLIDNITGEIRKEYHLNLENKELYYALMDYVNATEEVSSINEIPLDKKKELYDQFIKERSRDFFQLYLISLGKIMGYHNDDPLSYGMSDEEIVGFLEHYFKYISGFPQGKVVVKMKTEGLFTSREDLFEIAKKQIKAGFPVIYTGEGINSDNDAPNLDNGDNEKTGHVMLLYELTKDEQDIVLSRCWNGKETQTFYNNDYEFNPTIIYLDISELGHNCSANYFQGANDQEGFCICKIFSKHPNHEHNYQGKAYDESYHWNRCLCGDKDQIQEHILKKTRSDNYVTVYGCEDEECDYRYEKPHTFILDGYDQNGSHIYRCIECGKQKTSGEHSLMGCDILLDTMNSKSFHRITCICGYYELEMHQFKSSPNPRYSYCTKCGYTRDNLGIGGGSNVIMGKKEDEETE